MKRTENKLKLQFDSLSQNEALARALSAAFVMQLNPTVAELADIKCAVSEAVTNCTVHAYRDTVGAIFMILTAYPDRRIKIEIRDGGCGIEDVETAMQPLFTTDAENERSGMGFTVMDSFMDKLTVKSKPGRGTKVTMVKKLSALPR